MDISSNPSLPISAQTVWSSISNHGTPWFEFWRYNNRFIESIVEFCSCINRFKLRSINGIMEELYFWFMQIHDWIMESHNLIRLMGKDIHYRVIETHNLFIDACSSFLVAIIHLWISTIRNGEISKIETMGSIIRIMDLHNSNCGFPWLIRFTD